MPVGPGDSERQAPRRELRRLRPRRRRPEHPRDYLGVGLRPAGGDGQLTTTAVAAAGHSEVSPLEDRRERIRDLRQLLAWTRKPARNRQRVGSCSRRRYRNERVNLAHASAATLNVQPARSVVSRTRITPVPLAVSTQALPDVPE
jgi:hypothetical protein